MSLSDAQVDLNPHQVEAALFAFQSPLSKGAILADEVGFGGLDKTAEYKEVQAQFGIKSVHDLYCKFITDLNTVVTKRGGSFSPLWARVKPVTSR